jgi:hypothetical protein
MFTSTATTDDIGVTIDLTSDEWETAYSADRIVEWLRCSGGSLGERAMKQAAANLIEEQLAVSV